MMQGSHPEGHSPDIFAVFSEQKNLNIRSGIHILTPTSKHTTAYVHRAENVKVGGGVFATGNGRDVEHVLSALPPWGQMPSTDGKFRSLDFLFFSGVFRFYPKKAGGNRATGKQATTSGRAGRLASGPDTLDGINHNRRGVATTSHSNGNFRLDVSARVLNAIYVEFVLDESRPIARIQVRLADDTTFMKFLPILPFLTNEHSGFFAV